MKWHQDFGPVEGPLGFPMLDKQAQAIDQLLKTLPKDEAFRYRKSAQFKLTELMTGERTDVSWISTQDVDRVGDVVIAAGMDDSHYRLNPLVTLGHEYDTMPVGKSQWRKRDKDGSLVGVKAKTVYPKRPDDWPGEEWDPDYAWSLVKADLLRGKSIGFLPLEVHSPKPEEIKKNPEWANATLIIDKWLLLEYACCFLPIQQHAVVIEVGKAALPPKALHMVAKGYNLNIEQLVQQHIGFTTIEAVQEAIQRRLMQIDFAAITESAISTAVNRAKGRV
jgi:hypothetical protein